jgi:hypothetical protein
MAEHPITPPPELVQQWIDATESNDCIGAFPTNFEQRICTAAARWGADQEMEACCEWVSQWCGRWPDGARPEDELRAARRPKQPSLKEQALEALKNIEREYVIGATTDTIRRALEQLDD